MNEPLRGQKIGRNDPCPCGSGKKFKKCCLGTSPRSTPKTHPEKPRIRLKSLPISRASVKQESWSLRHLTWLNSNLHRAYQPIKSTPWFMTSPFAITRYRLRFITGDFPRAFVYPSMMSFATVSPEHRHLRPEISSILISLPFWTVILQMPIKPFLSANPMQMRKRLFEWLAKV